MPKKLFDDNTEKAVCNYYWTRLSSGYYPSADEAGAHFGCTRTHVFNLLAKHGFSKRTNAETREARPCRPIKNLPVGDAPLCACGCGAPAPWNQRKNQWNQYVKIHFRPPHPYHDPEWLRREYVDKVRTTDEIAAECGVVLNSIIVALRANGIPLRSTSDSLVLRDSMRGPNNPAWKGGIADWEYSHDWKRLCRQIKQEDQMTCLLCGTRHEGRKLHVHHVDGNKMNNARNNLVTLCASCHNLVHRNADAARRLQELAHT